MKPKVVVTNWVQDAVLSKLRQSCTVVANPNREPWPAETLRAHLKEADAAIVFMPDRIDAETLRDAPKLKMVSCCLKGFDNFDIDACSKRGVLVTILPDLLTEPGAELAIGMMIAAGRHILNADSYIRSGEFKGWRPRFYGKSLAESTIGILGFGAVGQSIAERLAGFRSKVIYWDIRRFEAAEKRLGATYGDFKDVISKSDFLVLALSLTPETRHIINAEQLSRMKEGSILINFARGSLVDEAAVAKALEVGPIGFYAADVFEFEDWALADRPNAINPALLALSDRTLFTPHLGSAVTRVREQMALQSADNIIAFFEGRLPNGALNAVNVLGANAIIADA